MPRAQVPKIPSTESKGIRDLVSDANAQETTADAPAVNEAVQVDVALGTDPVETANTPTTAELGNRTKGDNRKLKLKIGVFLPKTQKFLHRGGAEPFHFHTRDRIFRRNAATEVEQPELDFLIAVFRRREVFVRDVFIRPFVLARLHQLLDRTIVIHERVVLRDKIRDPLQGDLDRVGQDSVQHTLVAATSFHDLVQNRLCLAQGIFSVFHLYLLSTLRRIVSCCPQVEGLVGNSTQLSRY